MLRRPERIYVHSQADRQTNNFIQAQNNKTVRHAWLQTTRNLGQNTEHKQNAFTEQCLDMRVCKMHRSNAAVCVVCVTGGCICSSKARHLRAALRHSGRGAVVTRGPWLHCRHPRAHTVWCVVRCEAQHVAGKHNTRKEGRAVNRNGSSTQGRAVNRKLGHQHKEGRLLRTESRSSSTFIISLGR